MEKFTLRELWERFFTTVKYESFIAHRNSKYMEKLRLAYEVLEVKESGTIYVYLTPKNNFYNILGIDIGKRDINIFEKIFKLLLEGQVIPVQVEIAKALNIPRGTLKGYIQFLRKHEFIMESIIENFMIVSENGEIVKEYSKKKAHYVYYDIKEDGTREKLPNQNILHQKHGQLWRDKFDNENYLYVAMKNTQYKPLISVIRKNVWEEMNHTFGLNKGTRTEMLIINPEIMKQIEEYFELKAS
ncbi:hypothetical protein V7419_19780 [Bacillus sp. JJ689]|uniref:hypothetical protein n=1 Tax=Bacillus sp. JJ689 TaxID=3122949 RepID=UPI002FFFEEF1